MIGLEQRIVICHEVFDGFEIEQCKRQEPSSMDLYHYHGSYEIYYLLSGTRHYFIKDRTYKVEKGDLVLINKNDLHKTTYGGSLTHERILINFEDAFIMEMASQIKDIDLLQPFHQGIGIIRLDKSEQAIFEQGMFKIMKEAREKYAGAESLVRLSTLELLIFIARWGMKTEATQKVYLNQMHEKVSDIVKYINGMYSEKLTLKHVAEHFYISTCYLSRLFRNVTGFTFVEYLNSKRIKEAQQLLLESKLDIGEIAERTGYESATHFGRVFKQITGLSPLRFRKINKSGLL